MAEGKKRKVHSADFRPRPFAWCKTRGPNSLIRALEQQLSLGGTTALSSARETP